MTTYFCAHCGKARPVKGGYVAIDPRWSVVLCGTVEAPVEYPGHIDQAYVQERLDLKKAKALAKRKATLELKAAAERGTHR